MLSDFSQKNQQFNEDYTKTIQQNQEDVDNYFNRAMAYFYRGNYEAANSLWWCLLDEIRTHFEQNPEDFAD